MSSKVQEAFFSNVVKDFEVSDHFDCSDDDDVETICQLKTFSPSVSNIY